MSNKFVLAFVLICVVLLTGCKDKPRQSQQNEYLRPASMYYSHEDSANIRQMVDVYIENMKARNFEANVDMLYFVRNDSVFNYTEDMRKRYLEACSQFNIYDCCLKSLILRSDKNNEAKLLVQIIKNGDLKKEVGVTMLSLNPVKIGDKWYLTVLDKYAEGVEDVYAVE